MHRLGWGKANVICAFKWRTCCGVSQDRQKPSKLNPSRSTLKVGASLFKASSCHQQDCYSWTQKRIAQNCWEPDLWPDSALWWQTLIKQTPKQAALYYFLANTSCPRRTLSSSYQLLTPSIRYSKIHLGAVEKAPYKPTLINIWGIWELKINLSAYHHPPWKIKSQINRVFQLHQDFNIDLSLKQTSMSSRFSICFIQN